MTATKQFAARRELSALLHVIRQGWSDEERRRRQRAAEEKQQFLLSLMVNQPRRQAS